MPMKKLLCLLLALAVLTLAGCGSQSPAPAETTEPETAAPTETAEENDGAVTSIAALLEAAMAAPSAWASYPAEFIVMTDPDVRTAVSSFLPHGKFLAKAPLGFMVCGDLARACHGELSYMIQDCSACVENLLVAAHLLGLGACWLGVHPNVDRVEKVRDYFHLPENIIPVAAIAVGWSGKIPPPRTNYESEQVHLNAW